MIIWLKNLYGLMVNASLIIGRTCVWVLAAVVSSYNIYRNFVFTIYGSLVWFEF